MVAQFPQETTTPAKNLTPKITLDVNTYTESNNNRMCKVTINVESIQKELAIATFSRLFTYAQSLAINDVNPIPDANTTVVSSNPVFLSSKPETGLIFSVDASELVTVCNLSLIITNLRLDYMDEYFASTLTYLTSAIANDLNPDA